MSPRLLAVLLAVAPAAACKFDGSGLGGDDGPGPGDDGGGPGDDAAPGDGAPGVDARPPDAMVDLDADDDTILDATDNCVDVPNLDQHDEDADGVGDVCDNCPHIQNAMQQDTAEEEAGLAPDGVGDACDPDGGAINEILLFEPFTGAALPAGWTAVGGTWTVSGDALHQTSTGATPVILYFDDGSTDDGWTSLVVDTTLDVDTIPPSEPGNSTRSIGTLVMYAPGATFGTGYLCSMFDSLTDVSTAALFLTRLTDGGSTVGVGPTGAAFDLGLAADQTYFTRSRAAASAQRCDVVARGMSWNQTAADLTHTSGTFALRTTASAVSWRHVVVIGEVTP